MKAQAISILALVAFCLANCGGKEVAVRPIPASPSLGAENGAALEIGRTMFQRGEYALAADAFRRALRHSPDSADAYNGLASSYDALGRFDLSRRYYELALANAPEDSRILRNMARSMLRQGQALAARRLVAEAREVDAAHIARFVPQPAQPVSLLAQNSDIGRNANVPRLPFVMEQIDAPFPVVQSRLVPKAAPQPTPEPADADVKPDAPLNDAGRSPELRLATAMPATPYGPIGSTVSEMPVLALSPAVFDLPVPDVSASATASLSDDSVRARSTALAETLIPTPALAVATSLTISVEEAVATPVLALAPVRLKRLRPTPIRVAAIVPVTPAQPGFSEPVVLPRSTARHVSLKPVPIAAVGTSHPALYILNGVGRHRQAARMRQFLGNSVGWQAMKTANANSYVQRSKLYFAPGHEEEVRRLIAALPFTPRLVRVRWTTSVVLVLGKDSTPFDRSLANARSKV